MREGGGGGGGGGYRCESGRIGMRGKLKRIKTELSPQCISVEVAHEGTLKAQYVTLPSTCTPHMLKCRGTCMFFTFLSKWQSRKPIKRKAN